VEARELKLIRGERELPAPGRPSRAGAAVLGLGLVAATLLATWLGADRARQKIEVREMAEGAIRIALERGSGDPEVRETLVDLRRTLGWRPLESKTRVVYASLVLGLATQREDLRLAAFHAGRAADLAPVTVPVVRAAALVLAQTGDLDRALGLVRRMFGYEPGRAAVTLSQIESLVLGVRLEQAIPDDPDAWLAWSRRLREDDRDADAADWLRRTHERWPEHVPARVLMAYRAFNRRDWEALGTLVPPGGSLPEQPEAASLFIVRANLALHAGDEDEARADLETAIRLQGSARVRMLAGDVFEKAGDLSRARREWNRALHATPRERSSTRRALFVRLARLEDRTGRPAAALRLWEALLEIDPGHAEARRRVDDLTGFSR